MTSVTQKPNIVVIIGDDALTCAWIRSSAGHSQSKTCDSSTLWFWAILTGREGSD